MCQGLFFNKVTGLFQEHFFTELLWTTAPEINVGESGATDVIKYLKLRKIIIFLWQGPRQRLLFFTIFISRQ